jgi:hypothetical protein
MEELEGGRLTRIRPKFGGISSEAGQEEESERRERGGNVWRGSCVVLIFLHHQNILRCLKGFC